MVLLGVSGVEFYSCVRVLACFEWLHVWIGWNQGMTFSFPPSSLCPKTWQSGLETKETQDPSGVSGTLNPFACRVRTCGTVCHTVLCVTA